MFLFYWSLSLSFYFIPLALVYSCPSQFLNISTWRVANCNSSSLSSSSLFVNWNSYCINFLLCYIFFWWFLHDVSVNNSLLLAEYPWHRYILYCIYILYSMSLTCIPFLVYVLCQNKYRYSSYVCRSSWYSKAIFNISKPLLQNLNTLIWATQELIMTPK